MMQVQQHSTTQYSIPYTRNSVKMKKRSVGNHKLSNVINGSIEYRIAQPFTQICFTIKARELQYIKARETHIYFQLIARVRLYSLEFRLTLQCTDINVAKFGWFSHTAALLLKDFMYEFQPLNLATNVQVSILILQTCNYLI